MIIISYLLCERMNYTQSNMKKNGLFSLLIIAAISLSACAGSGKAQQSSVSLPEPPEQELASASRVQEPSTMTPAMEDIKTKEEIRWLNLEEAYALNRKEPRKIFVDVYTDWCGWCKKMDKETFANAEVAKYVNEHYYAVKLDAESTREFEMAGQVMTERVVARQMGVSSFPTIVFIHEDFTSIQPVPGYRAAKDFKEILAKFKAIDLNQKQ